MIINGLDNVETRQWINDKVHEMVPRDENGHPMEAE